MSDAVVIRCRENGPLVVSGPITVVDHLGAAFPIPPGKDTVALCRCGHSGSKPFCDGTHRQVGFQSCPLASPPPATA